MLEDMNHPKPDRLSEDMWTMNGGPRVSRISIKGCGRHEPTMVAPNGFRNTVRCTTVRGLVTFMVLSAIGCENTSGTCSGDGEAAGDPRIRAECDAPYFEQAPGCVRDIDCETIHDFTACQLASCAFSAKNVCSNAFAPCEVGKTQPKDQATCERTPQCHWGTLCLTTTSCADLHSRDTCSAAPYCDWSANPVL